MKSRSHVAHAGYLGKQYDPFILDADPSDPFEFFPDHYNYHLVAGYSKTTASGGLRVYMPDYGKISKSLSPR